jgi:hypothetical protein
MNRLYARTSKRRPAAQIDAAVRAEVAAHAEAHQLGDVLGAGVSCWETRSVRLAKPGLFARLTGSGDPDTEHRTVVLVASRFLVVAVAGEKRGVQVRSARLDGVSLSRSSELFRAVGHPADGSSQDPDFGVSITALWSGAPEAASFYLGVGDDSEGNAFLDELHAAVLQAKST